MKCEPCGVGFLPKMACFDIPQPQSSSQGGSKNPDSAPSQASPCGVNEAQVLPGRVSESPSWEPNGPTAKTQLGDQPGGSALRLQWRPLPTATWLRHKPPPTFQLSINIERAHSLRPFQQLGQMPTRQIQSAPKIKQGYLVSQVGGQVSPARVIALVVDGRIQARVSITESPAYSFRLSNRRGSS